MTTCGARLSIRDTKQKKDAYRVLCSTPASRGFFAQDARLLFVVAFKLMLVLALVGLVLRCRYHISGWEGNTADINRTMDRVSETVAGWTDQVKVEFSRQWDKERNREFGKDRKK